MIYPEVDSELWARKHGLPIKMVRCMKCKQEMKMSRPIAIKGYRGFQSELHSCGKRYVRALFIPVGKEERKFWLDFKYGT